MEEEGAEEGLGEGAAEGWGKGAAEVVEVVCGEGM